jgi:hypothetical protein
MKSRAAVYIKNKNYEKAVDDCTAAIEISQNDPIALNRLLNRLMQKLFTTMFQKYFSLFFLIFMPRLMRCKLQLTRCPNLELVFNVEEELEKREKAADNIIVLAKERMRDIVFGDIAKNDMERVTMSVRESGVPFFLTPLNPSLRWTWLTGCKRR